jgi:CubicO group peptidase (beta-lactamase class C family)
MRTQIFTPLGMVDTTSDFATGPMPDRVTFYGLGWMLENVPLAGEPTLLASHASRTLPGGSTSFMTFPERGIVVAVTSNTSFADTRSIALKIAQAFAEQGRSPART